MSEFVVNTDMFGQYVRIPTGYSGEPHIYKVVSLFQSNTYCDVPIVAASVPVPHKKEFTGLDSLEHVLNVIHCGIDESKVIRVALKDCEIVEMQTSASEKLQQYREIGTVDEVKEAIAFYKNTKESSMREIVEKCAEYEKIGTINECRAAVEKQKAKALIHIHREFTEHQWRRDEDGNIDEFAMESGYHNGPVCERCGYTFCEHCNPDGWDEEPCVIDKYCCPNCNEEIMRQDKYCNHCGQAIDWSEEE